MNITPTLEDKRDSVQNVIDLAHVLGIETPKVALLSAVETVNPRIRSSIEAAAICKMADRGQISGGVVDGPLAFDTAVSQAAAKAQRITSPVTGQADILVAPDLETGTLLAKQLEYLAEAQAAGVVLGARVPIALVGGSAGSNWYATFRSALGSDVLSIPSARPQPGLSSDEYHHDKQTICLSPGFFVRRWTPMPAESIQSDLIRRLRSAEGHLRGITGMVESGAVCQEVVQQVQAVRGALDEIDRRLIHHHLHDCLRNELASPNPAVREHAIATVIAFYGLAGAGAPLSNRKETL
jgi:DNA-binding FrmR family transcriptional regulator